MTTKQFYDFVIKILEEIIKEVVMENPNAESIFPCIVVPTPLRVDTKVNEYDILQSRFSIICEAWTKKKSLSIDLADKIDEKLRGYNFKRTGTPIDLYDNITKCHRCGGSYDVFYNAINNSFDRVR